MWKCPNCGREFKNENHNHFCGEAPKTVDEYISAQPDAIRPILDQLRETLRKALPNAKECISWSMPTYRGNRNIIHFAAHKKHIGLYLGDEAIEHFKDRLSGYRTRKGTVQLPYDKSLPLELIAEIAKWCYETGNHN